MEEIIISYCFFTPKSLHKEMRFWDLYNSYDRYWYNIPALMAVNNILYPNAKVKIHISKEIETNPLFEILSRISESMNVELVFMPYEYINTEPTMWRYKPLFDKEADVVLCRDIDSLPNEDEIRSTLFFLKENKYKTHTLRTHTNHGSPGTIILAGLCGFRPKEIYFLNNISFDAYYSHFKSSNWGLDQNSLINLFVRDQNWTSSYFLDSPISTEYHKVSNPLISCNSFNQNHYKNNVDISKIDSRLLDMLNTETKWAGEPTNLRGDKLKQLLDLDIPELQKMKDIINNCSEYVKNFYLSNV